MVGLFLDILLLYYVVKESEMTSKQTKRGFTIVELLTVMSIIILLLGILVPALNRVRKVAKDLQQKAQFYDIDKALAEYRDNHQDEYPDSNQFDAFVRPYCGAMKLCEAIVGQDGMGYHPDSRLLAVSPPSEGSGPLYDSDGELMYPFDLCIKTDPAKYTLEQRNSLKKRIRYLEADIKSVRLDMIYGAGNLDVFNQADGIYPVLTDVYNRADIKSCSEQLGNKVGMPILYYKADVRSLIFDPCDTFSKPAVENIYDFRDNHFLVRLPLPWESGTIPPMADLSTTPEGPTRWFYNRITNPAITSTPTPYKRNSYIMISAGYDGIFGTNDDVFSFRR